MFCVNKNRNRLLLHILLYIAYTIIYLYIIVNIIVYIYMENDKFFKKKKQIKFHIANLKIVLQFISKITSLRRKRFFNTKHEL